MGPGLKPKLGDPTLGRLVAPSCAAVATSSWLRMARGEDW